MSTCNQLNLQTLGSHPIMPENLPITDPQILLQSSLVMQWWLALSCREEYPTCMHDIEGKRAIGILKWKPRPSWRSTQSFTIGVCVQMLAELWLWHARLQKFHVKTGGVVKQLKVDGNAHLDLEYCSCDYKLL